ncbi:hypothetical protein ACLB1Q_06065 [Escherichia coli]
MTGGSAALTTVPRNAGLYTLAEQQAPDRHARAACTQAGGAFHTALIQYGTV